MELTLIEIQLLREKLTEELQWIENHMSVVPEGLKAEMQALYDSRKALYDSLSNVIDNTVISIPAEAQTMASRYVVTGTEVEDTVNTVETVTP